MKSPTVSFIVPCYKLGHLLPECINSILSQTYPDFEIVIMDDCSPDCTSGVAKRFQDSRVKYVRNQHNLGLIDNFNKGISLSRGKYTWIISADDYLRRPYIVKQYIELMERNPHVGYTFCPGVTVESGQETGIQGDYGKHDRIVNGRVFLRRLLEYSRVVAASAMARRECYDKLGLFPKHILWAGSEVDMRWSGDWYLWCLFALQFDVGYLAEPMVCYRQHDLSITSAITHSDNVNDCAAADIAVPWLIRQKALECGITKVPEYCLRAVAQEYAAHRISKKYRSSVSTMTENQFEDSLCKSTASEEERKWIRARVSEAMGDKYFWQGDLMTAKKLYLLALQTDSRLVRTRIKLMLLFLGTPGRHLRRLKLGLRNM